jgi:tripeptidyl-peptidase I
MDTASIKKMMQPSDDSFSAVREWLGSHGFGNDMRIDSDWIHLTTTIAKAEEMLQAKYQTFRDLETGIKQSRTLSFSLPRNIKRHVSMIHPTTSFAKARGMKNTIHSVKPVPADNKAASSCSTSITPSCLASLYGYGSYAPSTTPAKMGVAGFLEQWPQKSDLTSFEKKYIPSNTATFPCVLINGGLCSTTTNSNNIVEANLDIQYAVAISGKIPVTYYSTGGRPPLNGGGTNDNEPYLEFLNYLLNVSASALPTTVSISYGDTEDTVPASYASTVCNLFAQVGARGVSFLAASGDGGADCDESGSSDVLVPIFPGGCPYVTAVGALVGVSPEKAVSFSGGGFSNYFAQPSYQSSAVSSWISGNHDSGLKGLYNASGRAFPDVSAQGSDFHVFLAGSDQLVSGTSAATPAFASIINLVNNELVAKGKSPLGFLNPFLYSTGKSGLTDITAGSSTGCSDINGGTGFTAVSGWDPVTGLGSPSFTKLVTAAG